MYFTHARCAYYICIVTMDALCCAGTSFGYSVLLMPGMGDAVAVCDARDDRLCYRRRDNKTRHTYLLRRAYAR